MSQGALPVSQGALPVSQKAWKGRAADAAALLIVVTALLLPDRLRVADLGWLVAVPVELIIGTGLLLILPPAARRPVATGLGLLLGALTVLKIIDAGFYAALSRPFDLVLDWRLAGGAWTLLTSSLGVGLAVLVVAGAGLVALGVPATTLWAVRRLTRLLDDRPPTLITPAVVALAAFWLACSATGLVIAAPHPVAAHASATKVVDEIVRIRDDRLEQQSFAAEIAADPAAGLPSERMLAGLRGKRVLLVFVESYGRVALDDPAIGAQVRPLLDDGTTELARHGLQARSGYLTSPITGGGSWLAHATLLSGLRVENQRRYLTLVDSRRLTLTEAFQRAGWRTFGVMPGVIGPWPEGAFYHYDEIHDSYSLGYTGPAFGWSRVPDQFTLAAIDRVTADSGKQPVMAVVPLVTSHAPWSAVPPMVDWARLSDGGTAYDRSMADTAPPEAIGDRDPSRVRADYARSITYSLRCLISYLGDDPGEDPGADLVMIVVGDHQPAPVVTGPDAGQDVPITMITADPGVLQRIDGWGWSPGLRPASGAPVWPMESFRDRFLTAFASGS